MNTPTMLHALFVLALIAALAGTAALLQNRQRRKDSAQAARQALFYRACRSAGMYDGDDLACPERRQRIEEIAAQHGLTYSSLRELGCILDEERISYEARRWPRE